MAAAASGKPRRTIARVITMPSVEGIECGFPNVWTLCDLV
jgi:hypothetical protein